MPVGRVLILLLLFCLGRSLAALPAGTRYVMSHFRNDGGGGDERLYISISEDALNWTALNGGQAVYAPPGWSPFANVVRDPAIIHANGYYWVAYTSGTYGRRDSSVTVTASFGLARSADLLNWTYVGEVNTVIPGATNPLTWSPTFFRDGDGTVRVFVAISPDGGANFSPVPGMRVHELHPLNAEWTQWSAPVPVELPSTNTNELWVWKEAETYHGIFVDFARSGSPYVHVTSSDPVHGWGAPQVLGFPSQEGGFVLKRPDGGYRFYSERGNASGTPTYLYTDGDAALENLGPQQEVQSTVGMRNGKAIAAPDGTSYEAWRARTEAGGPEVDADHDGKANLLEFGLGSDPRESGPGTGVEILSPGLVRYRRANGAEAALSLEVSSELPGWESGAKELSRTLRTDGTEEVVARDVLTEAAGQRFYRLRVAAAVPAAAPSPARAVVTMPAVDRQASTPRPVKPIRPRRAMRRAR